VELVTRRVERWLWPNGTRSTAPVPAWTVVARFAYALARDLWNGDLSLRAMGLVYTTMLAIVPLLAIAFSLLKGLGFHRELAPLLQGFLAPLGPRAPELTERIVGFVDNVSSSALASISIAILLFSALSMAQKVEGSFNYVWRVDRPRSLARRFSEYLSVMLVGPLLMSVAMGFIATLTSTAATSRLGQVVFVGAWIETLSSFLPYLLVIASFTFLYVFVPNTRVRFVPAIIGGVFAGVLWAGGGSLFANFVVSASRTEAIYSGFAIVIVAMLWLYLSWLILLLGAQLAFYVQTPDDLPLGTHAATSSNALRERLALAAMLLVGKDFDTPGHGWRIESLAARMRVPRHVLDPVIDALTGAQLLTRTNEQRLIPARDPRRIAILAVLAAVRDGEATGHAAAEDWSPTVNEIATSIEESIRRSLGSRTLADLVDADARNPATRASALDASVERPRGT
jgi:membrane protein